MGSSGLLETNTSAINCPSYPLALKNIEPEEV